jgi:hypothetical protein
MTADIITALRARSRASGRDVLLEDAADELESLERENTDLRAGLQPETVLERYTRYLNRCNG